MSTPQQDSLAEELRDSARDEARAREVLNRPPPSPFFKLITMAVVGVGLYLIDRVIPAAQNSHMILIILSLCLAENAVDSSTDRRRLEAAITLLKLRDQAH